jgi:aspartyl-tRNA(Asn)/glutamyl-tRNA(Gln) amidotransferase subunit A
MTNPETTPWSRRKLLAAAAGTVSNLLPFNTAHTAQPTDLTQLSLTEAMQLLRRKSVSPVELTQACLTRIERLNPAINVFITVSAERALQQSRVAEKQIMSGRWLGPLHGIPLALKDLIDTAGIRTTAASAVFQDRIPTQDAEVVRRLKAAGAVLLGKLNMHEFAYGGTSVPSHFGAVHNPWNLDRIAGGSSGGSAAAVAAGMCFGALGTDTAASVRHPAAYCGIVGLKPTYGRVSTRGVIPLSWSLDHVGPLCRTVTDTALLLETIAGYDPLERTSVDRPPERFSNAMRIRTAPLRLGVVRRPYFDELDPDIETSINAALKVLQELTSGVRDVELPYSANLLMTVASVEAYAYHKPYFSQTPQLYQEMTRQRLQMAASIPAADYANAIREMQRLRWQADSAFANVDLLITPTTAIAPISIAAGHLDPPLPPDGTPREFRNTHMFDVLGLPAISVPCGFTRDGLPIGLQIAGSAFSESHVLALAHAYQQATTWHTRIPWPSNTTR